MSADSLKLTVNFEKSSVVLLDIAGTTTSHSFVKDTFHTYITDHSEPFLKAHSEEKDVKEAVKLLKEEGLDIEQAVEIIKNLTKKDDKNLGLRKLHSLISQMGYESGELKASVFPDVPLALETWSKLRKIAIFSSGNVLGQKLHFTHTTEGDLSSYIQKYFDETFGSKTEASSYEKIAKDLEVQPEEVIFITDRIDEAKAAKKANVVAVLIKRDGNELLPEKTSTEFTIISSFEEIKFDKKRKNEEEAAPVEEQPPTKVAKTKDSASGYVKVVREETKAENGSEAMEVDSVSHQNEQDSE